MAATAQVIFKTDPKIKAKAMARDDEMMSEEEATQIIDEYRASMPYEERVKDLKKFRAEHMTWLDDVVMSEEDMLKIKNRKRAKVPLIIDLSQPDPVWT